VRNWARVQIGVLSLLCNIFFRLRTNFPNDCLQSRLVRVSAALKVNSR
jgi:hypothetical protein